jgi:predicted MPP superfamily phosphohydrolase
MNIEDGAKSPAPSAADMPSHSIVVKCRENYLPKEDKKRYAVYAAAAAVLIVLCVLVPVIAVCVAVVATLWLLFVILFWAQNALITPLIKPRPYHPVIMLYYLLFVLSLSSMFKERFAYRKGNHVGVYDLMFYNCLGGYMLVICGIWFVEAIDLLHVKFSKLDLSADEKQARAKKRAIITWGLVLVLYVQSAIICYADPTIIHLSLPISGLPPCFAGYKLAVLSDIHVGALVDRRDVANALKLTKAENVDILALVGDFGDQHVTPGVVDSLAPFKEWADEGGVPVVWTSGNHENYAGIDSWRALITDTGIVNIENDFFLSEKDGCSGAINFVGLADTSGTRMIGSGSYPESDSIWAPDLSGVMKKLGDELGKDIGVGDDVATVVLSHTPVEFLTNAKAGSDLMISGHTHGGHVFPFHLFTAAYDGTAGLFEKTVQGHSTWLYVSEGVIGWGPRVRLFSRPEITIISLVGEDEEPSGDTAYRVGQFFVWVAVATVPASVLFCLVRWYRGSKEDGKEN